MNRRKFITSSLLIAGLPAAAGLSWIHYFDGPLFNECALNKIPDALLEHELMKKSLAGLDMSQLWDCHFHLIGNGLNPGFDGNNTGVWLNPGMSSWLNPVQRLQYGFYLDAACIEKPDVADITFIDNVQLLVNSAPPGIRMMLLAFDYQHDESGVRNQPASTFYVPNEYAARLAESNPSFEWIASVHPYREDALVELEQCAQKGARAVKWLPPAMNIDPSSAKCDQFYAKLVELGLPLLTHAGEEKAVHSEELQALSNPLLLRRPLEQGVKVIVAHCASLGQSVDFESNGHPLRSNFELFARLMDDEQYQNNLLADISALNLFNRNINEIKQVIINQHWHQRLLYASDYPLPGVMPIISSTNLASNGLLAPEYVEFLTDVRKHNVWLFDLLQKRLMAVDGMKFSDSVFQTRRHFIEPVSSAV